METVLNSARAILLLPISISGEQSWTPRDSTANYGCLSLVRAAGHGGSGGARQVNLRIADQLGKVDIDFRFVESYKVKVPLFHVITFKLPNSNLPKVVALCFDKSDANIDKFMTALNTVLQILSDINVTFDSVDPLEFARTLNVIVVHVRQLDPAVCMHGSPQSLRLPDHDAPPPPERPQHHHIRSASSSTPAEMSKPIPVPRTGHRSLQTDATAAAFQPTRPNVIPNPRLAVANASLSSQIREAGSRHTYLTPVAVDHICAKFSPSQQQLDDELILQEDEDKDDYYMVIQPLQPASHSQQSSANSSRLIELLSQTAMPWRCTRCTFSNFGQLDTCSACKRKRQDAWPCNTCGKINHNDMALCRQCKRVLRCQQCTVQNSSYAKECNTCGNKFSS